MLMKFTLKINKNKQAGKVGVWFVIIHKQPVTKNMPKTTDVNRDGLMTNELITHCTLYQSLPELISRSFN